MNTAVKQFVKLTLAEVEFRVQYPTFTLKQMQRIEFFGEECLRRLAWNVTTRVEPVLEFFPDSPGAVDALLLWDLGEVPLHLSIDDGAAQTMGTLDPSRKPVLFLCSEGDPPIELTPSADETGVATVLDTVQTQPVPPGTFHFTHDLNRVVQGPTRRSTVPWALLLAVVVTPADGVRTVRLLAPNIPAAVEEDGRRRRRSSWLSDLSRQVTRWPVYREGHDLSGTTRRAKYVRTVNAGTGDRRQDATVTVRPGDAVSVYSMAVPWARMQLKRDEDREGVLVKGNPALSIATMLSGQDGLVQAHHLVCSDAATRATDTEPAPSGTKALAAGELERGGSVSPVTDTTARAGESGSEA